MDYRQSAEDIFKNMARLSKHVTIQHMSDISKGEMAILGYLHFVHDGATAGELSEASCVVSSRIAAVLNALEKKGYARRKPDPRDKRKVLVHITETGHEEVIRRYEEGINEIAVFLLSLGEEDTLALQRILHKIVEHGEIRK
ncbi:MAG: MarR family transcriptional regulator [Clostridium sp.]|nr:MarR family transcriptional regulator [Clostridium sp.]